jgi:hypothetical protein
MKKFGKYIVLTGMVLALLLAGQISLKDQGVGQAHAAGPFSTILDIFADAFGNAISKQIAKGEKHLRDCKAWCEDDKDCVKCSRKATCGKGYKKLKGWTGPGKNWYACAVAKGYKDASKLNHDRCESWCKTTERCSKCSKTKGCGRGFKALKGWTGKGKNWYACEGVRTHAQASRDHQKACNKWCKENKDQGCVRCSKTKSCGKGLKSMKAWTGYGKNWYACKKHRTRDDASKENQEACNKWCKENKDKGCVRCSKTKGCGKGHKSMKAWTGYGKNWYACKKSSSSRDQASQSHEQACNAWCDANPDCAKCSDSVGCGRGYKKIKSWTGYGKNWYACKKR